MWADNFITELNDTHVEAELRTKHIPPQLNVDRCVGDFAAARRRLLVLGYNATLTTSVDTSRLPKRQYDQYSVRMLAIVHFLRVVCGLCVGCLWGVWGVCVLYTCMLCRLP